MFLRDRQTLCLSPFAQVQSPFFRSEQNPTALYEILLCHQKACEVLRPDFDQFLALILILVFDLLNFRVRTGCLWHRSS